MQDQPTSTSAASCDQFAGHFRLLGIDPTATLAEVEQAYAASRQQRGAPEHKLTEARSAILDPARRLLCELTYPLDCSAEQLTAFYDGLSGNAPMSEMMAAANDLPPLSRANFLAHLATREPADASLMFALVGAHASVDAATIFEILKDQLTCAGFPMPPLLGIRQGLQELFTVHAEAVVAAYGAIQDAAVPLEQCIRKVLVSNDRHHREALTNFLDAYRQSLAKLKPALQEIDAACDAIKLQPDDVSAVAQLKNTFSDWISINAPLIVFDAHQKLRNEGVNRIIADLRRLPADLIAIGKYETAQTIAAIYLDALSLLPDDIEPFKGAATALRKLSLEARIKPLETLIEQLDREPKLIALPIEKKGFADSDGRALWETFSKAVSDTHATDLHEQPWILIRDFAFRLDARPESKGAASRLASDLLRFGETLPATPTTLDALREDLNRLEATNGPIQTGRSRPISYAKAALFIGLVLIATICTFLAYRNHNLLFPSNAPVLQANFKEEQEAVPPASKGERFKREFVRYCHFQEERLRVLKQYVQGPLDIQAYNMFANDYNSRCSNFYFLDEDLRVVTEEVKARKQMLEADAMRILSTWPWHPATGTTSGPAAK
ncbi:MULTISPECIES: hypothetical protein [Bradyrhizobium]|uniref:hypothetical protein n=1 Tax=Bradyrhizobium TaxID=374 RepID=UPI000943E9D5|nr:MULTISPECIES: hypothetical protein [Bradyrhizobium]